MGGRRAVTSRRNRHLLMTTDTVGGVWQYSIELATGLAAHGYRTTLATLGPPPTPVQRRAAADVPQVTLVETALPLDWLSDNPASVEQAARQLAEMAKNLRADCIHLNTPALAGAALWPAPVVTVAHGCIATWWQAVRCTPLDARFTWHRDLVRRGLLAADAVLAPSRAYAEDLCRTYNLPLTPAVVNNGRRTGAYDKQHPLAPEAVTVGRLWDEAKNVCILDQAAALTPTPIIAAGAARGPHDEEFKPEHLRLAGHLSDGELAQLLTDRPIFVSAAKFEPFGLAVLEAAAAGCALVLSDIPTFRELWEGVATFVSPNHARGFADAIDGLAADQARREELGMQAAERAARYTPEACAAGTAAIHDKSLARKEVAA